MTTRQGHILLTEALKSQVEADFGTNHVSRLQTNRYYKKDKALVDKALESEPEADSSTNYVFRLRTNRYYIESEDYLFPDKAWSVKIHTFSVHCNALNNYIDR